MKVLLVHGTNMISGGEAVSLKIAGKLKNVDEFTFFLPGQPKDSNTFRDFKVYYPEKSNPINIIKSLIATIREEEPQIIHAQGTRAAFFVKFAFVFGTHRAKFIYTLHGIHFIKRRFPLGLLSLLCEKLTNGLVDALVCVGRDDFDLALELKLIKSDRLFLIDNGIDVVATSDSDDKDLKKELDIKGKTIITTVCRLHYQKDVDSLIRAFSMLQRTDVELLIVGDGPERTRLERLSSDLGLNKIIYFLGNRSDVGKILSITDIFVLSTNWEGRPLVVLEAWAHKKPVVVSNVHGLRDLIEDGKNGLLFNHGNPKDLSVKIESILDDKNLGTKLGGGGYNLVKSKYTSEIMSENYNKLYMKISDSS